MPLPWADAARHVLGNNACAREEGRGGGRACRIMLLARQCTWQVHPPPSTPVSPSWYSIVVLLCSVRYKFQASSTQRPTVTGSASAVAATCASACSQKGPCQPVRAAVLLLPAADAAASALTALEAASSWLSSSQPSASCGNGCKCAGAGLIRACGAQGGGSLIFRISRPGFELEPASRALPNPSPAPGTHPWTAAAGWRARRRPPGRHTCA